MRSHTIVSIALGLAAFGGNVAQALPSAPGENFGRGLPEGETVQALAERDVAVELSPDLVPLGSDLSARDMLVARNWWNDANKALSDWAAANLAIPVTCIGVTVAGTHIYIRFTTQETRNANYECLKRILNATRIPYLKNITVDQLKSIMRGGGAVVEETAGAMPGKRDEDVFEAWV